MNLTQAYIFLVVAILLEITATSFLKDTQGFTKWIPSLVCIIAVSICMYLMSHVMKIVPVGITYATWSGLGIPNRSRPNGPGLNLTFRPISTSRGNMICYSRKPAVKMSWK